MIIHQPQTVGRLACPYETKAKVFPIRLTRRVSHRAEVYESNSSNERKTLAKHIYSLRTHNINQQIAYLIQPPSQRGLGQGSRPVPSHRGHGSHRPACGLMGIYAYTSPLPLQCGHATVPRPLHSRHLIAILHLRYKLTVTCLPALK
jgi:hypothetical protein